MKANLTTVKIYNNNTGDTDDFEVLDTVHTREKSMALISESMLESLVDTLSLAPFTHIQSAIIGRLEKSKDNNELYEVLELELEFKNLVDYFKAKKYSQ